MRTKKSRLYLGGLVLLIISSVFFLNSILASKKVHAIGNSTLTVKLVCETNSTKPKPVNCPPTTVNGSTTVKAIPNYIQPGSGYPTSYNLAYTGGNNSFKGGLFTYGNSCTPFQNCTQDQYTIKVTGIYTNGTGELVDLAGPLFTTITNGDYKTTITVYLTTQVKTTGTLNGNLTYGSGNQPATLAWADLFSDRSSFTNYCGNLTAHVPGGGLIYNSQADVSGKFSISGIQPGNYFFFSEYQNNGVLYAIGGDINITNVAQDLSPILSTLTENQAGLLVKSATAVGTCHYPLINSIDPNTGPTTGGTQVTITGSGFLGTDATGQAGVEFGDGNPALSYSVVSDTKIIAFSPPGAVGSVEVIIYNHGNSSHGLTTAITYQNLFTYVKAVLGPPTCQSTGGDLAWITCTLVNIFTKGEAALETAVLSMLKTNNLDLASGSTYCRNSTGATGQQIANGCIFSIWSNFRIYGDVFLVIALLIAVIVEAVGGGMVSSYTIRKMLPRIVVAVILINLSIYVVAILEDIFNILGGGLYDLIKAPFGSNFHFSLNSSGTGDFLGMFGLVLTVAGGGALSLLWAAVDQTNAKSILAGLGDAIGFMILFVAIPVFLAVLGVLLTLMFRQAILIFLLMISPVAFALYCLPNTEKYFKKWWDLLIKTLVVYPVIVILFCMAQVMAIIFGSGYIDGDSFLAKILAMIAIGIPLFLIPFAFRFSGGIISNVSGIAKNLGNKAGAMAKGNPDNPNSRGNLVKARFKNRREEAGLSLGAATTGLRGMARTRGNMRTRAAGGAVAVGVRQSGIALKYGQSVLSKNPTFNSYKKNDNYLTALIDPEKATQLMEATSEGSKEREDWEMVMSAAKQTPRTQATIVVAAQQMADNGTAFAAGQTGHDLVIENAAKAAGAQVEYEGEGVNRHAKGFLGSNAGVATNIMNGHKVALVSTRADLANIGSVEYNPMSKYTQIPFEDLIKQKKETFVSVNAAVELLAKSKIPKDLAMVAKHLEELKTLSESGNASPDIAMEAKKGIESINKILAKNSAWWQFSGQTVYNGNVINPPQSPTDPMHPGYSGNVKKYTPDPLYLQAIAQARRPRIKH